MAHANSNAQAEQLPSWVLPNAVRAKKFKIQKDSLHVKSLDSMYSGNQLFSETKNAQDC